MEKLPTFVTLIDDGDKKRYYSNLNVFVQAIVNGQATPPYGGDAKVQFFFPSDSPAPNVPQFEFDQLMSSILAERRSKPRYWNDAKDRKEFKKKLMGELQTLYRNQLA